VRILYTYIPMLIVSLIACKNKQEQRSVLRFSGFDKAEALFDAGKYDSSFYYFTLIAINSTDSLRKATALSFMGLIQTEGGDYFGAQETYLKSLPLLDERKDEHRYCFQSIYKGLGDNSLNLKNYDNAIRYFDKALSFTTDNDNRIRALNSKAVTYQKAGAYNQADSIYEDIVGSLKNNPKEYARVLSNQARNRWQQDSSYPAAPYLLQALSIRESIKDDWGLNASYSHLSDFYVNKRPDSALYYAEKMYVIAQQIDSPDDQLEALAKLISLGHPSKLRPYFLRYKYLNDSIQIARNAAKNQFSLIRYEVAQNKSVNLELQKDNAQKKLQLLWQQVIIGVAIALFIAIGFTLHGRYRKRQLQTEAASRLAIETHQLKTSQKVHDVVANGLYLIMADLQYRETIEKEPLLDKIDVLYERSRDISYEPPAVTHHDFQTTISALVTAFASPTTKVYVTGNDQSIWDRISNQAQLEIEQVLQELMINMKKHSAAQTVVLKFESQGDTIQIHYKDDGVGLPSTFKYGNGLTNTGNRINRIGGNLTFEPTTKGLQIRISIPTV
jgi:signal transduction histidine kinase